MNKNVELDNSLHLEAQRIKQTEETKRVKLQHEAQQIKRV